MIRKDQWTKEELRQVRANILWCILYACALLVVALDIFVWRP